MNRPLFITLFSFFLLLGFQAFAQDEGGTKSQKVKVKKEKRKGMGSQKDLDALNQDATQSKAYKDYMKKIEKERKVKAKRNEVTRKKAEKTAEKRRKQAARNTKSNKRNYGVR